MASQRQYDFNERLMWSQGFLGEGIAKILENRLPSCIAVEKATTDDDRNGTDYWAIRDGSRSLSVDVKIREVDFAKKGYDDLALETWSVLNVKPGWTRDASKETDYILWFWQDTGRFFLCAFPPLCHVFSIYWRDWADQYRTAIQDSYAWKSECVFVPRITVIEKLSSWQNGTVLNQSVT